MSSSIPNGVHKFSNPQDLQKFLNPLARKVAQKGNDEQDPKDNPIESRDNEPGAEILFKQGKEISYEVGQDSASVPDVFVPNTECPDQDGQKYFGDKFAVEDNVESPDEVEARLKPRAIGDYQPLEFANAAEMFLFFERISGGTRTPYVWQLELLIFLSKQFYKENPLRFYLQACNGSGKDSYIIALFAVWFIATKIRSRFIGTSSSYTQLEGQTENYIRTYAAQINAALGEKIFLIKKQHIVCAKTGSEIVLFSTNEPGRAEGWHPHPDYPEAEMCICVNEAKTVPDEIFLHLKKCTGYNLWLEVSSPGSTSGHFYNECRVARQWNEGYDGRNKFKRKVTYRDCPHISKQEVHDAATELGETNFWVRATYYAEFTDLDSEVVIGGLLVDNIINNPPPLIEECPELPLRAGIDFAGGGDEDTVYVCKGNYLWRSKAFRETDTVIAAEIIINFLVSCGFRTEQSDNIFVDDGNVGHMLVDTMRHRGWDVVRVSNGSRAGNGNMYSNKGTELWFNLKPLFEQGMLYLPKEAVTNDQKLIDQLKGRKYKRSDQNSKLTLLSKRAQKNDGYLSPDRADAFVLANCKLRWKALEEFFQAALDEHKKRDNSFKSIQELMNEEAYRPFNEHKKKEGTDRAKLNLNTNRIGKKQLFSQFKRMVGI